MPNRKSRIAGLLLAFWLVLPVFCNAQNNAQSNATSQHGKSLETRKQSNPLRGTFTSVPAAETLPATDTASDKQPEKLETPQPHPDSEVLRRHAAVNLNRPVTIDGQVAPAVFSRLTANAPSAVESEEIETSAATKFSRFAEGRFGALFQKLALNTLLVLTCGVSIVLGARRWMSRSLQSSGGTPEPFRITSTLQLTAKTKLQLVEVGEHRVLVASDPSGVKSVLALTGAFSTVLDGLDHSSQDEIEDKSGLDKNAGLSQGIVELLEKRSLARRTAAAAGDQ